MKIHIYEFEPEDVILLSSIHSAMGTYAVQNRMFPWDNQILEESAKINIAHILFLQDLSKKYNIEHDLIMHGLLRADTSSGTVYIFEDDGKGDIVSEKTFRKL